MCRFLTITISVTIILSLSLCASAESFSYTYTKTDVSEYSGVAYFDPTSGNYVPMEFHDVAGNVNVGDGSTYSYDFRFSKTFPKNMQGDGAVRFSMEMENPYVVPSDINTIKLQFNVMIWRYRPAVLQGYQDATLLVNGRPLALSGVTVDAVNSQRYIVSLYADVSSLMQGKEISLEGFSLTLNFSTANADTQYPSSVNCYCRYPVFEFSKTTVEEMIQDATNQITQNVDENTQRIIDNNGLNADKIMQNQDKNTQEIIDSNKQNTQDIIDSNKQNTQDIIDGDPANREMLEEQKRILDEIKEAEEIFTKSITGDLDLNTDEMLKRFGEVQNVTSDGAVVESNNWIQELFSAVVPPINVNFWAEYFLLVPVALSVVIMFSVKILRTVVPAVISRSDRGEEN